MSSAILHEVTCVNSSSGSPENIQSESNDSSPMLSWSRDKNSSKEITTIKSIEVSPTIAPSFAVGTSDLLKYHLDNNSTETTVAIHSSANAIQNGVERVIARRTLVLN
jgi:hypothetical protein